jgi:signal transduction histidine kinase
MLVLLAGVGWVAYAAMGAALLEEIDTGLQFRAESAAQAVSTTAKLPDDPRFQEPTEAFEQVLTRSGEVRRSTPAFRNALVSADDLRKLRSPTFFQRTVTGAGALRILAVPVGPPQAGEVLVLGASMSDRADALRQLGEALLLGEPVAVALACLAAWTVAGWALHPMDRMREQAAAISVSGLDRRLSEPRSRDELQALARTLNDMLDRLAQSLRGEQAFLAWASHELRTPLSALRAEVELALRRPRTAEELTSALRSVAQESERLVRLTNDLLVLSRAEGAALHLRREPVVIGALLCSAAALSANSAAELGVSLVVDPSNATVRVDPVHIRQALVNLVDNALRHTPRGGQVRLSADVDEQQLRIEVADTGSGFDGSQSASTPGLGLRVVAAVAASHGGVVETTRGPAGGAVVRLLLPCDDRTS